MNEINDLKILIDKYKSTNYEDYGISLVLIELEKEINRYLFLKSQEPNQKRFKKSKKVQIGVCRNYLQDFINIDFNEPADILFDVRNGIPLESKSINFIFSEHFFEHLDYPKSAYFFLEECYRILETGGELVIGVPDTSVVIEMYQSKNYELFNFFKEKWYSKREVIDQLTSFIDILNIHMRDEVYSKKYSKHLWSYDYEKLQEMLIRFDFEEIERWNVDKMIVNPDRINYTLYIKAKKK